MRDDLRAGGRLEAVTLRHVLLDPSLPAMHSGCAGGRNLAVPAAHSWAPKTAHWIWGLRRGPRCLGLASALLATLAGGITSSVSGGRSRPDRLPGSALLGSRYR
jgi:hypothetical protein